METRIIRLQRPFQIQSKVFIADPDKRNPSIFITPIFGRMPIIENLLGRLFAYNGFNAFITDFMPNIDPDKNVRDLDIHDRTFKKSVLGLDALKQKAKTLSYVDPENFGLYGMSLGGIFTLLNAKISRNFKASVVIAGAGDHARILSETEQITMKKVRRNRKKAFGVNDYQYKQMMEKHNKMDPIKHHSPGPDNVFMFVALKDRQIPTKTQLKTVKDLKHPKVRYFNRSHFGTILTVPFTHFREILKFYSEKFSPGGDPGKNVI